MYIPAGYAQCNFLMTGTCVPRGAQITFGVDVRSQPDGNIAISLIKAAWESAGLAGGFSQTLVMDQVLLKYGPNETGPAFLSSWGFPGGDGSQALPQNVALLVRKGTLFGGHRAAGRMFVPGLTEAVSSGGGQITPQAFPTYVTGFEAFLGKLKVSEVTMALLHSKPGDLADPDDPTSEPLEVTSLVAQQTLATQRRRLRG